MPLIIVGIFVFTSISSVMVDGYILDDSEEDGSLRYDKPGEPCISPGSYDFGALDDGMHRHCTFEIYNKGVRDCDGNGARSFDWEIVSKNGNRVFPWITVSTMSGTCPPGGNRTAIDVDLDTTDVSDGFYNSMIKIKIIDGPIEATVDGFEVSFSVGPVLGIVNGIRNLDFGFIGKDDSKSKVFQVVNFGYDTLNWSIDKSGIPGWLSISPGLGSCGSIYDGDNGDLVVVSVDSSGLDYGEYSYDVVIDSNGGSKTISVEMIVCGAFLMYSQNGSDWEDADGDDHVFTLGSIFRNGKPGDLDDGIYSVSFDIWNKFPGRLEWEVFVPKEYNIPRFIEIEKYVEDKGDGIPVACDERVPCAYYCCGDEHPTSAVVDVLDNDIDFDGSLDPSSVTVVDGPSYGSIEDIDPVTGMITYVPERCFSGMNREDSFTYTVKDNEGHVSNKGTVTVCITLDQYKPIYGFESVSGVSMGPDDKTTIVVTIDTTKSFYDHEGLYWKESFFGSNRPTCPLGSSNIPIKIKSNDEYAVDPEFGLKYYVSNCDPREEVDYVIITTDALLDDPTYLVGDGYSCKYSLYDLAEAHEVIDDFNVTIKSVNDIYREYRDLRGNVFSGDLPHLGYIDSLRNALNVREYIRDMHLHCGLEYVMLVGDDDWNMKELNVIAENGVNGALRINGNINYKETSLSYGGGYKGMYIGHHNGAGYYHNLDSKFLKMQHNLPGSTDLFNGFMRDPFCNVWNVYDVIYNLVSGDCTYHSDGTVSCNSLPVHESTKYSDEWYSDTYSRYSTEVPTFQVPPDTRSTYKGNVFTAASDRPYACLGSDKYNRNSGLLDISSRSVALTTDEADVYVGRAPADTPQDVSSFVEKTVKYMASSNDKYCNAVVLSDYLGYTNQPLYRSSSSNSGGGSHSDADGCDSFYWDEFVTDVSDDGFFMGDFDVEFVSTSGGEIGVSSVTISGPSFYDSVDIGDSVSESGRNLNGWSDNTCNPSGVFSWRETEGGIGSIGFRNVDGQIDQLEFIVGVHQGQSFSVKIAGENVFNYFSENDGSCLDCYDNTCPVALPDKVYVNAGSQVSIDVLSNDSDPDPCDGIDSGTVEIVKSPDNGSCIINQVPYHSGRIDYNAPNYPCVDIFYYTVKDFCGTVSNNGMGTKVTVIVGEQPDVDPDMPVVISDPNPSDDSMGVSTSLSELSVYVEDPENKGFSWSIATSGGIGGASGESSASGTISCSVSGLIENQVYSWMVTVTDSDSGSGITVREHFSFSTGFTGLNMGMGGLNGSWDVAMFPVSLSPLFDGGPIGGNSSSEGNTTSSNSSLNITGDLDITIKVYSNKGRDIYIHNVGLRDPGPTGQVVGKTMPGNNDVIKIVHVTPDNSEVSGFGYNASLDTCYLSSGMEGYVDTSVDQVLGKISVMFFNYDDSKCSIHVTVNGHSLPPYYDIDYEPGSFDEDLCDSMLSGPACLDMGARPIFTDDFSRAIIDKLDPWDYIPDFKGIPFYKGLEENLKFGLDRDSITNIDFDFDETVGIPSKYFDITHLEDTVHKGSDPNDPCFGVDRWVAHGYLDPDPWDNKPHLVDLMNDGVGIINHFGHAERENSEGFIFCNQFYSPPIGGASKDLRLSGSLSGLENNVYPVIYSIGDYGGMFDNNRDLNGMIGGRSMGERLLFGTTFGVSSDSVFGCSAGVFNSIANPGDEYIASLYNRMFWDNVFAGDDDKINRSMDVPIGKAFHIAQGEAHSKGTCGRVSVESTSSCGSGPVPASGGVRGQAGRTTYSFGNSKYSDYYYYGLNLFGDPALRIKGSKNHDPEADFSMSLIMNYSMGGREVFSGYAGFLDSNGSKNRTRVELFDQKSYIPKGAAFEIYTAGDYMDPDGLIKDYQWEFSSGIDTGIMPVKGSIGIDSGYDGFSKNGGFVLFDELGNQEVTLTVTDNNGATDSITKSFIVVDYDNKPAEISSVSIVDGSLDVSVDLSEITFEVDDFEGDSFDWRIKLVSDSRDLVSSQGFVAEGFNEMSGVKKLVIPEMLLSGTVYRCDIFVQDHGSYVKSEYRLIFTTETIDSEPLPPVALDDSVYITNQEFIGIDVLGNDYGIDGSIIPSTVSIIDHPDNGVISSIELLSGRIKYTPDTGFKGVDSFSYTVSDDMGLVSNPAVVDVRVGMNITVPDLIVTNSNSDEISLFVGKGDGSFSVPDKFDIGSSSRDSAVGDFNWDGNMDVAVGRWDEESVVVLYGDGRGDFSIGSIHQVGEEFYTPYRPDLSDEDYDNDAQPYNLFSGDFNHDGWLDILVGNYGETLCRGSLPWEDDGSVSILFNDASGGFIDRLVNLDDVDGAYLLEDFNSDGYLDLVSKLLDDNCVSVTHSDGSYTSSCNHKTMIYSGNADDYNPFNYYTRFPGTSLDYCTGDFDGDGNIDIVKMDDKWDGTSNAAADGSIKILFGDGTGNFNIREHPYMGGTDGFGYSDITQFVRKVPLSDTNPMTPENYRFKSIYRVAPGLTSIECGDFDGDGDLDIVTGHSYGSEDLCVFLNNGSGVFLEGDLMGGTGELSGCRRINFKSDPWSSDWRDVLVYDFNSDNILDLATANSGDGSVSVLLGDGTGDFNHLETYDIGGKPYSLSIGDFSPPVSNLGCNDVLSWSNVSPGSVVNDSVLIKNPGSLPLNWEVSDIPDWGVFSLTPSSGNSLMPGDYLFVDVSVVAPSVLNESFSGIIRIENVDDPLDFCEIVVSLSTSNDGGDSGSNQPPVALDDSVSTDVDEPFDIDVLSNDIDGDGVLDPSSVAVVDNSDFGSVVVDGVSGIVTYSPDFGFVGFDGFSYTVCDDDGGVSNVAFVSISVGDANHQVVIGSESPSDGKDDVLVNISKLCVDISDFEGDGFSWSIECSNGDSASGTEVMNDTVCCMISSVLEYKSDYVWYVNASDTGSGITVSRVYSFSTIPESYLNPSACFVEPVSGGFYLQGDLKRVLGLGLPIVVGGIDLEVEVVNPSGVNISNVSFYLDDGLLESLAYNISDDFYGVVLDERLFGVKTLSVELEYDGKKVLSDEIDVFIVNFNLF